MHEAAKEKKYTYYLRIVLHEGISIKFNKHKKFNLRVIIMKTQKIFGSETANASKYITNELSFYPQQSL